MTKTKIKNSYYTIGVYKVIEYTSDLGERFISDDVEVQPKTWFGKKVCKFLHWYYNKFEKESNYKDEFIEFRKYAEYPFYDTVITSFRKYRK